MTSDDQKLAEDVRDAFRRVTEAVTKAHNAGLMVSYSAVEAASVGDAGRVPIFAVQIGRPV